MKRIVFACVAMLLCLGAVAAPRAEKRARKVVTTVFVTDIHCSHCVNKIMNNVPMLGRGIKDVQVNLDKKEVTVVYDASKSDVASLVAGFASLKVKAEPKGEGANAAPAPESGKSVPNCGK